MHKAEEYARVITQERLGKKTASVQRFPTGLSHFVFDVKAENGFTCVIRIARPERAKEFERGVFWHRKIESIGVRLPQIYQVGEIDGHHYAVYERLSGDDLENVYASLSASQKRKIAEEVAEIQRTVSSLDRGLFERAHAWEEVLQRIISRSEREIHSHGLCDLKYVDLVRKQVEENSAYFQSLKPLTFLYDLNVRNVIVDKGKVTGIIDVDEVWFGDPLLAVGRGKTILLAMRQEVDFIEHWCKTLALSAREIEMVDFYALLYCLRFMGTIGTQLNGNGSIQTDPANARLFESIADSFLGRSGKLR